ncbi:MAG TPA: coproporphyrinogen dehydrogenase HemZ [Patescibacteria group bacterium]|nr:coproporphyrinogen dehydrogenase HemZ [Patescibacteria group bacterium]
MTKIKRYRLAEDLVAAYAGVDVSRAVRDMMLLFGVHPATEAESFAGNSPEEGDVTVHCRIHIDGGQVTVWTRLNYRQSDGSAGRIEKEEMAVCDGEDIITAVRRLIRLNILRSMRTLTGCNTGPWGILHGVRPTKIIHRLLDRGFDSGQILQSLQNDYDIDEAKAQLILEIARRQRDFLPQAADTDRKISIYVGIPYCPSRCLYCSFPSQVLPECHEPVEKYLAAIEKDMEEARRLISAHQLQVQCVYLGGGTPTSLNGGDFSLLLEQVKKSFVTSATQEFTVEAGRPDSLNAEKIQTLKQAGVNRVSINPQTMQQGTLDHIGRQHTVEDIVRAFHQIRSAGIPVINMDIIAGLPGETEQDIRDTMERLKELQPDNVTVHTLALKRGSRLMDELEQHPLPGEQTTVKMLAIAADYAKNMGMVPYYLYRQKRMAGNLENVGYCHPGAECLYNMNIMEERQTILGIGPGAGTKAVQTGVWSLQSCYHAKDVQSYIKNLDVYISERARLLNGLYHG